MRKEDLARLDKDMRDQTLNILRVNPQVGIAPPNSFERCTPEAKFVVKPEEKKNK